MHKLMKKHLVRAAIIAAASCSVSYTLAAADGADTTPQKTGSTLPRVAGTAAQFVDDVAITTTVKAKLIADDLTKARDIKVVTNNGIVQLIGQVDSVAELREAESVARSVEGVQSIKNELKLKTP